VEPVDAPAAPENILKSLRSCGIIFGMSGEPTERLPEALLRQILAELGNLSQRLTAVEQGQARLEQGQANLEQGQTRLEQRLTVVEEKVDRRQLETRPIWERALAEIADVRAELATTQAELVQALTETRAELLQALTETRAELLQAVTETRAELSDVKAFLRDVRRDQRTLNDTMMSMKSEMRDVDERLARLEGRDTLLA
jgi:chromosome segregation ATPase